MIIGKVNVQVVTGDITTVPAEVLITSLDPTNQILPNYWCDNISKAIRNVAGDKFHDQLYGNGAITDGKMVFASGDKDQECVFGNVLFIVSESAKTVHNHVFDVLKEAEKLGMKTASMPAFHTSAYYDTVDKAVNQCFLTSIYQAVIDFIGCRPKNLKHVIIVIHENESALQYLRGLFKITD